MTSVGRAHDASLAPVCTSRVRLVSADRPSPRPECASSLGDVRVTGTDGHRSRERPQPSLVTGSDLGDVRVTGTDGIAGIDRRLVEDDEDSHRTGQLRRRREWSDPAASSVTTGGHALWLITGDKDESAVDRPRRE